MNGNLTRVLGVVVIVIGMGLLFRHREDEAAFVRIGLTAAAFGLISAGANLLKTGQRQLQPKAEGLLRVDKRPPVLWLRSFNRDHDEISRPFKASSMNMLSRDYYIQRTKTTPEEELFQRLEALGPVVALGRPGETLQPLGASRFYVPDDEWKDKFRSVAAKAALIVMMVDNTDSLKWELGEIQRTNSLSCLMLVLGRRAFRNMPHHQEEDSAAWEELRRHFPFLPSIASDIVAVTFGATGKSRTFKAVGAAITSYADSAGI